MSRSASLSRSVRSALLARRSVTTSTSKAGHGPGEGPDTRHGQWPRIEEMAQSLGISENTIKFHVRNILRKLGLRSRAELLRLLVD